MRPRQDSLLPRALLLIGPPGSGKSPVGMILEALGPFRHFDFGSELRAAAEGRRGLEAAEVAFVRRLLERQLLLPDERFDLAARLLERFLARSGFEVEREWLILNGLPRRVGQARDIATLVRVEEVFVLECDAETTAARVARRRRGEGLDHRGRADDTPAALARKLATYHKETLPVLEHYRATHTAKVHHLEVLPSTSEEELARAIAAKVAR